MLTQSLLGDLMHRKIKKGEKRAFYCNVNRAFRLKKKSDYFKGRRVRMANITENKHTRGYCRYRHH